MSSQQFQDLLKRKKEILEKVRKERELLKIEKQTRSVEKFNAPSTSGHLKTQEDLNKMCLSFGIPSLTPTDDETTPQKQEAKACPRPPISHATVDRESAIGAKLSKLSVSTTYTTDIQPEKTFTSTKSTQTNVSRVPLKLVIPKYNEIEDEYYLPEGGYGSKLPPGCMSPGLPQLQYIEPAVTVLDNIREESTEVKELTDEEKNIIISSKKFQKTFKRLGRVMENVVAKNVNITKDYIRGGNYDDEDARSRGRLSLNCTLCDSQWTANRCVTSIDWSTYNTEMMVASYHINTDDPLAPDGVVVVWNKKSKRHDSELVFHSPSAVLSTCFAQFNHNLILGGTYSGQIVVWDIRSPKPIPVQTTTLNCGAHMQPVHSMQIIGNENSHNLISISSEGKLCSWSLDMLSEPVDTLLLEKADKRPVASTCMAFSDSESNKILVGSEDGNIYYASRSGFTPGVIGKFGLHDGPITAISMHCNKQVFLSSSVDGTIKLWSLDNHDEPLHTFKDNFDYVMDVAWSPTHPALFAAVDGSGRLDLWNLNMDTETPTVSVVVNGQPALNRLTWSPSGQYISVGDIDGSVFLYDVAERLTQPLPGESSAFENTIKNFK